MKVAVMFPMLFGVVYLVTVFVFEGKDLAARESGFPAYTWVLPVRTVELVGWPMVFGVVQVAIAWVLLARLVMNPMGVPAASAWPAALLGAVVASVQAMLWAPWPVPFARVVGVCCVVVALVTVGVGGREAWGISEGMLIAIYSVVISVSFAIALRGVGRARHGEEARWQWVPGLLVGGKGSGEVRRGRPFASAAGAQLWMEWKRNGVMLVLACCGMWALMLAPILWQWRYGEGLLGVDAKKIVMQVGILLTIPILLSMVMGAGPRRTLSSKRDLSMSSFMATRPIGVGTFVRAKLWGAALSTALVWGVALVMVGLLMLFPVTIEGRTVPMGAIVAEAATGRQVIVACAVLVGLILVTWKFQTEGIFVGVFGRAWVAQTYSIGVGAFCVGMCVVGAWLVNRPDLWDATARVTRWGAVALCVAKIGVWAWVMRELVRRGFASRAMVAWGSAAWVGLVVALSAVAWVLTPGEVKREMIVAGVVLVVPLVRLGAAPLALAGNRHR
jgi:hypothetical protein